MAVKTESDFPRQKKGAGSTELNPKPAGPYEGFGRRNQDLLVQKAGVTPPGRLTVL